MSLTVNPLLSLTGDFFLSTFEGGGLIERGGGKGREKGLFNLAKCINGEQGFSRTEVMRPKTKNNMNFQPE